MFPVSKFSSVKVSLQSDVISPKPRLFRYKSETSREPYYKFELTSVPLPLKEGVMVDSFLDSCHGNLKNFDLQNPIPQHKAHSGLFLGQSANKGSDTIVLAGVQPNEPEAVTAGDFLQINGSKKAYRILESANSNSSGQVTVKLTQGLIQSHSAGATIAYGTDVTFQVCVEDRDSGEISVKQSKFVVHDLELIEQI